MYRLAARIRLATAERKQAADAANSAFYAHTDTCPACAGKLTHDVLASTACAEGRRLAVEARDKDRVFAFRRTA